MHASLANSTNIQAGLTDKTTKYRGASVDHIHQHCHGTEIAHCSTSRAVVNRHDLA
eukprot:COSAG01_NODE_1399_length_10465_cov_3.558267_17_plen_56_part_00